MESEFTIEKVEKISKDKNFMMEFLNLSHIALLEAKEIFKSSLKNRNLTAYRQMSHKLHTNLKLLGLVSLESLIQSGKELFEKDEQELEQFSEVLELNMEVVIERVSSLRQQFV